MLALCEGVASGRAGERRLWPPVLPKSRARPGDDHSRPADGSVETRRRRRERPAPPAARGQSGPAQAAPGRARGVRAAGDQLRLLGRGELAAVVRRREPGRRLLPVHVPRPPGAWLGHHRAGAGLRRAALAPRHPSPQPPRGASWPVPVRHGDRAAWHRHRAHPRAAAGGAARSGWPLGGVLAARGGAVGGGLAVRSPSAGGTRHPLAGRLGDCACGAWSGRGRGMAGRAGRRRGRDDRGFQPLARSHGERRPHSGARTDARRRLRRLPRGCPRRLAPQRPPVRVVQQSGLCVLGAADPADAARTRRRCARGAVLRWLPRSGAAVQRALRRSGFRRRERPHGPCRHRLRRLPCDRGRGAARQCGLRHRRSRTLSVFRR